MSTPNVSFSGAIRDAAAALGRVPTTEQVSNLELALQSLAQIDPATNTVTIATDAGTVPVDVYLAREAASFPKATTDTSSTAPGRSHADRDADDGVLRIGASTQYGRPRGDVFADIARGLQATHDAALAREAVGWPNPWTKGAENRTRQVLIQKVDPAKAAQFRAEAEA